jgi:hypothetical protein
MAIFARQNAWKRAYPGEPPPQNRGLRPENLFRFWDDQIPAANIAHKIRRPPPAKPKPFQRFAAIKAGTEIGYESGMACLAEEVRIGLNRE